MGSGGVAIAALPTVICLKVPFSDGLGGVLVMEDYLALKLRAIRVNKPSFCHHHHS